MGDKTRIAFARHRRPWRLDKAKDWGLLSIASSAKYDQLKSNEVNDPMMTIRSDLQNTSVGKYRNYETSGMV